MWNYHKGLALSNFHNYIKITIILDQTIIILKYRTYFTLKKQILSIIHNSKTGIISSALTMFFGNVRLFLSIFHQTQTRSTLHKGKITKFRQKRVSLCSSSVPRFPPREKVQIELLWSEQRARWREPKNKKKKWISEAYRVELKRRVPHKNNSTRWHNCKLLLP